MAKFKFEIGDFLQIRKREKKSETQWLHDKIDSLDLDRGVLTASQLEKMRLCLSQRGRRKETFFRLLAPKFP